MCLTLFVALAALTPAEVVVDEITMGGSALDRLQDPVYACNARGLSSDGQTVVGYGTPVPNSRHLGFTWSEIRGVRALPVPKEMEYAFSICIASCISGDGKVMGGMGLWTEPDAKIAGKFKSRALPASALGKLPITDTSIEAINRDGTVMVVKVSASKGDKLFLWSATKGLQRLSVTGSASDISADGKVVGGVTFKVTNVAQKFGFVVSSGRCFEVPFRQGYVESTVEAVTADGKLAFGNYWKDQASAGFVWKFGAASPTLLPGDFVFSSASEQGEVIAGWSKDKPALLVGKKVFPIMPFVKGYMPDDEAEKLSLVSVKKVKDTLYVLADGPGATTDYRISIPMSRLK